MNFKVYKIETYGMKNIKEKMTIEFYPKTIGAGNKKLSNIKAIYGANGAGKSAFINSVKLYKQLLVNNLFLKQNTEIKTLNKIINQKLKEFYFSIVYGVSKKEIYKHEIQINFENEIPFISFEKISKLNSKTTNGDFNLIVEIINGEWQLLSNDEKIGDIDSLLINKTKNMLKYTTLGAIITEKDILKEVFKALDEQNSDTNNLNNDYFYSILLNRFLGDSIVVYLDSMDIYRELDESDIDELFERYFNNNDYYKKIILCHEKDIILKKDYDKYEKSVKKLFEFLRIFKTDLLNIEIEKKEDEESFYCYKKLVYRDYKVDSEYESTGIKKMMDIFYSIEAVTKNKIVFIDELDSNISGVYLIALLEYLNSTKKGQLCFTSHNLYPMHYLYNFSNAIDFIGETGKIVTWVKNGNYRPYKLYPEGMIADSPFNIDPIDFISVFEAED